MLFLGIGAVHPPGLPPSSNSPLAAYTEDPVWQQHARYFDSIFAGGDLPHQQTCYKPTSQRRSGREDRLLGRYGTEADALLLLADGSFERSGFSAFLARLDPADSFIFAGVRKPLLDSSATILQDDSGIPLGYFEARRWRFEAFGHYAGPIIMFANFYQPQMAELFKGARPIEFGIGYQWRKNESNLLLAQKESSPSGDAELTPPSQAEGNAAGTGAPSPKKTRKRMETEATRSPGCRIARVLLVEAK